MAGINKYGEFYEGKKKKLIIQVETSEKAWRIAEKAWRIAELLKTRHKYSTKGSRILNSLISTDWARKWGIQMNIRIT